jgi:hypothetical protein
VFVEIIFLILKIKKKMKGNEMEEMKWEKKNL